MATSNYDQDKILEDYTAAARSVALNLNEFCDRSLPYYTMIAAAARKAFLEIEKLRKELEETKIERNMLAQKSDDPCSLCANHVKCDGKSCECYECGVGDADGKYPNFRWSCEDFNFGTCRKLENTPCNGCIENNHAGFVWREKS